VPGHRARCPKQRTVESPAILTNVCVKCDWPLPVDMPWEPKDRCYHCAHPERAETPVRTFHMQTNDPCNVLRMYVVGGDLYSDVGERDANGYPTMAFCRSTGPRRWTLPTGGQWCEDCQKIWMGVGRKCKGRKRRDEPSMALKG